MRVALFFRAVYLLLVFAPFLLLGVPLLLLATCLPTRKQVTSDLLGDCCLLQSLAKLQA